MNKPNQKESRRTPGTAYATHLSIWRNFGFVLEEFPIRARNPTTMFGGGRGRPRPPLPLHTIIGVRERCVNDVREPFWERKSAGRSLHPYQNSVGKTQTSYFARIISTTTYLATSLAYWPIPTGTPQIARGCPQGKSVDKRESICTSWLLIWLLNFRFRGEVQIGYDCWSIFLSRPIRLSQSAVPTNRSAIPPAVVVTYHRTCRVACMYMEAVLSTLDDFWMIYSETIFVITVCVYMLSY